MPLQIYIDQLATTSSAAVCVYTVKQLTGSATSISNNRMKPCLISTTIIPAVTYLERSTCQASVHMKELDFQVTRIHKAEDLPTLSPQQQCRGFFKALATPVFRNATIPKTYYHRNVMGQSVSFPVFHTLIFEPADSLSHTHTHIQKRSRFR